MTEEENEPSELSAWRQALWLAIPEWLVGVVFATLPFTLGVLVFALTQAITGKAWTMEEAALSTVSRGELLIFSVTFLAPMMWTVSIDKHNAKAFPYRPLWIVSVTLVLIVASLGFGIWRAYNYNTTSLNWIFGFSLLLAFFAVMLRYLIQTANTRHTPSPETMMNVPTNDWAADYAKSRGAGNA